MSWEENTDPTFTRTHVPKGISLREAAELDVREAMNKIQRLESELWRATTHLVKCEMALDDFFKTGEKRRYLAYRVDSEGRVISKELSCTSLKGARDSCRDNSEQWEDGNEDALGFGKFRLLLGPHTYIDGKLKSGGWEHALTAERPCDFTICRQKPKESNDSHLKAMKAMKQSLKEGMAQMPSVSSEDAYAQARRVMSGESNDSEQS